MGQIAIEKIMVAGSNVRNTINPRFKNGECWAHFAKQCIFERDYSDEPFWVVSQDISSTGPRDQVDRRNMALCLTADV